MEGKPVEETFQNIVKEGWLEKRSRFLKGWRRRWIVLTPHYICTFKKQGQYKDPTEKILLAEFSSFFFADEEVNKQNSFKMITHDREFYFAADDTTNRDEWLSALGRVILNTEIKGL